jgi:uncharacterized protein with PQ loop repeat
MEEILFNGNILNLYRFLSETTHKKNQKEFPKTNYNGMDIAMIIAPLITYLFQILKFNKTKSSKGFSKFICLLLFLGNILRIFFWYGTRFRKVLLYQSIGIVLFQIILIHLCVKYQDNSKLNLSEIKNTNDISNIESKNNINIIKNFIFAYFSKTYKSNYWKFLNHKLFWNWTEEKEYYKFIFFITALLGILSYFLKNVEIFFQAIGILGAIFEASICIPQVVSNCRTKVTKNISFLMIFCWFLGDSFRLFYNLKYNAPLQLIIAITVQIVLDFVVLLQLMLYKNRKNNNYNNNHNYKNYNNYNNKYNNYKKKSTKNSNKKQIDEINQLMKSIDEINTGK